MRIGVPGEDLYQVCGIDYLPPWTELSDVLDRLKLVRNDAAHRHLRSTAVASAMQGKPVEYKSLYGQVKQLLHSTPFDTARQLFFDEINDGQLPDKTWAKRNLPAIDKFLLRQSPPYVPYTP